MNGRTNVTQENTIGALIPLEESKILQLKGGAQEVKITWEDPVDKVANPGGELVAEFDKAVIVKKINSDPTSPTDGEFVTETAVRNQYSSTPYVDADVTDYEDYHYAVYSVTKYGMYSDPAISTVIPGKPNKLVYDKELSRDKSHITHMNYHTDGMACGSVDDYAIFAGGSTNTGAVTETTVYDSTLVENNSIALTVGRENHHAASLPTHVLFCGGESKGWSTDNEILHSVEGFTNDLVSLGKIGTSAGANTAGAGGALANLAFFAGGQDRDIDGYTLYQGDQTTLDVTVFDDDLVKYDAPSLNNIVTPKTHADGVLYFSGASSTNHMIFAGGKALYNSSIGYVTRSDVNLKQSWVYDKDMTLVDGPDLPSGVKFHHASAPSPAGGVIFAGGKSSKGEHDNSFDTENPGVAFTVDYISDDLIATSLPDVDKEVYDQFLRQGIQYSDMYSILGSCLGQNYSDGTVYGLIYDKFLTRVDDPAIGSITHNDGYTTINAIGQTNEYCIVDATNHNTNGNYGLRGAIYTYKLVLDV